MYYIYVFSGLPGIGKTTLAKQLAQVIPNTAYFRLDTVEYYLKKAYPKEPNKQGYELVYYQAKQNHEL
ncbi:AAA family ATPase, partial [Francisella tularensis subsp. holarctica]|uniref:AAA family ATPase n=1 Tax=Francisella tularensis TaxID=263 RepID=UPI002381BF57